MPTSDGNTSKNRADEAHPEHKDSTATSPSKLLKYLTVAQRVSAPFITIFAGIHLAAPISAIFGGSAASNRLLLLGREYYQGPLTEPLLLFIPLGIHIGSSLARRALLGVPKRPSLVTLTGYAALLSVPFHIFIHRIIPSSPDPPISSYSPSELNFEFVKASLHAWPITSWLSYTGLVAIVALHGGEGGSIINRWLTGKPLNRTVRRTVAILATFATMYGLYVLSNEPLHLRGRNLSRVLDMHLFNRLYA
ncbi:SubName: Full=Uncharacterized protein {ECO:0000313/EMBL:CCA77813.1} [Serendipita indica DSM 11827]|uniref:Mitochondrial adapter protein MCP1 transmembrane domain-containing protein n=1 Tax=Serendipita indica (strain DSM 11827) TaxID=1109443 RepID=G4U2J6_SERID|nr:SubName: Full=Uncharacterized protein {ECO:0000313/EMBL:CCA77813.1} [Serendipita indica DSM 11827]CCA77813.1 hypothetical protein PIIN_03448 [Serendipita indica DSM 11827]